ncbi:hypothetical protein [Pseudorhodoferax sp. Leaf274]|uniref:hypothetical protein n=1 Tax=Pseudorhodoferax sp. Leaf274 TaxID=1736318 RepID=UPI000AFF7DB2|nr:hypothetical protein [Pseudorhodoferax sp. Leaf274]
MVSLCLAACGGSDDDAATPNEPTQPTGPTATIAGKAVDGRTGLPIAGVSVRVGTASTSTAADGSFTLPGLAPGSRVPVVFASSGYAENGRIADLVGNASTDVQARLLPVATTAAVPVATGGTVDSGTARVVLPANGVQRADGTAPTGDITVQLTPIDSALDPQLMPGDFRTGTAGGTTSPIESFGALNVTLTDSTGAALNLRSGQTATIRIPAVSRGATPPDSIPLYYYDTATGLWKQEGTATRVGSGTSAYYEGTVTHFSTWNADQVYTTVFVRGCVKDGSGAVVANAYVGSDGIDYVGTSYAYTDASGNFSLPVRKESQAAITAVAGGRLTNTVRNQSSAVDINWTECLTLSQAGAGITMKLTWGALPTDLDSHLMTPSGEEVDFSNDGSLTAKPFANLDVDDTSSYGPEVITITKLMVGTYKYSVHRYSSGGTIAQSGARVEVNIPGRAVQLITPPTTGETGSTDYWNLFEFDVSANCTITVRPVQTYTSTGLTAPTTSEPQYCTP